MHSHLFLICIHRLAEIVHKLPAPRLRQPLLRPRINLLGKELERRLERGVMRNHHKHIVSRIQALDPCNRLHRLVLVHAEPCRRVIPRPRPAAFLVDSAALPALLDGCEHDFAGARHGAVCARRRQRDLGGQWAARCGAELGGVVCGVAAHEDEARGRGGDARQPAQVADGVAGRVQQVEGAVAEVVVRGECAGARCVAGEVDFMQRAPGPVALGQGAVWVGRVGRGFCGGEAGADDEGRRGWEGRGVAGVVEVVVAPDDGFNVGRLGRRRASRGRVIEDVGEVLVDCD